MMTPLLSVSHISKIFQTGFLKKKENKVLTDVSFTLEKGTTLGLIGPSGAGKSTLVRIIMQLIQPTSGNVLFQGVNLSTLSGTKLRREKRSMQMLFQNPSSALNPRMTIKESMEEPLRVHHLPIERFDEIPVLLDRFQLRKDLLSRYPQELSGGEIQRLCLARLLLIRPQLLILDEPTSMLDASVQAQIIRQLKEVQKEKGMAYLFISHDLELVHAFSDFIGILYEGRLVELQKTEELFKNPQNEYTRELISAFREI